MDRLKKKVARRSRIKEGIRKNMRGTAERPRLTVYRSNTAIYAQIINDLNGETLAAASSLGMEKGSMKPVEIAKEIGKTIAGSAMEANIATVVFDRNGYLYHGRVKALADGAREAGLNF